MEDAESSYQHTMNCLTPMELKTSLLPFAAAVQAAAYSGEIAYDPVNTLGNNSPVSPARRLTMAGVTNNFDQHSAALQIGGIR